MILYFNISDFFQLLISFIFPSHSTSSIGKSRTRIRHPWKWCGAWVSGPLLIFFCEQIGHNTYRGEHKKQTWRIFNWGRVWRQLSVWIPRAWPFSLLFPTEWSHGNPEGNGRMWKHLPLVKWTTFGLQLSGRRVEGRYQSSSEHVYINYVEDVYTCFFVSKSQKNRCL